MAINLTFQAYNPTLLPEVLQIWNSGEFGQQFPLTPQLWRQQVENDPSFRAADFIGALTDSGDLVGFVLTKQFRQLDFNPDMAAYGKLGWIAALVVAEAQRKQGVGTQLLKLAEERLQVAQFPKIALGGNFRHFFPGLPSTSSLTLDFFQKHGYNLEKDRGEAFDLRRALEDYQPLPPVSALASGEYYFAQGRRDQAAAILEFLQQTFPGRWRYSLNLYFAQGGDPGDVILLLHRASGSIEGFLQTGHKDSPIIANSLLWYRLLGENYGGIGPLGVSSKVRGQNLGLALVDAGVNYLRSRGVTECAIDWTSLALLDFYGKLGFQTWRTFQRLSKEY